MSEQVQQSGGPYQSSVNGLTATVAAVAAYFAAPFLHEATFDWSMTFGREHYPPGMIGFLPWIHGGVCGLVVFFVARLSLTLAVSMGGLALAARFFT